MYRWLVCAGAGADGTRGGRQRVVAGRSVLQSRPGAGWAEHRPSGRRRAENGVEVGARPAGGRVRARAAAGHGPGARARAGADRAPKTGPERRAHRLVQVNPRNRPFESEWTRTCSGTAICSRFRFRRLFCRCYFSIFHFTIIVPASRHFTFLSVAYDYAHVWKLHYRVNRRMVHFFFLNCVRVQKTKSSEKLR